MKSWEYLFQSQKGHNQPISRVQAYRILRNNADKLGIDEEEIAKKMDKSIEKFYL